jgi:hypothetical protein
MYLPAFLFQSITRLIEPGLHASILLLRALDSAAFEKTTLSTAGAERGLGRIERNTAAVLGLGRRVRG